MYWASSDDAFHPLADAVCPPAMKNGEIGGNEQWTSYRLEFKHFVVYHPHFPVRQAMRCVSDADEHLHLLGSSRKLLRPAADRFWPLDYEHKPKAVHSIAQKDYETYQSWFEAQYCG